MPKATRSDMGGSFGACGMDTFCNIHDANQALSCFARTTSCDRINIDGGGHFGDCALDGFCNAHDRVHALLCFSNSGMLCPCGPAPELPDAMNDRQPAGGPLPRIFMAVEGTQLLQPTSGPTTLDLAPGELDIEIDGFHCPDLEPPDLYCPDLECVTKWCEGYCEWHFHALGTPCDNGAGVCDGSGACHAVDNWCSAALVLPAGATFNARVGASMDADDGRVAVGAPQFSGVVTASGGLYIYEGDPTGVGDVIYAADGVADDLLGIGVAVADGRVFAGAAGDDDNGSVYVFQKPAASWVEVDRLYPDAPIAESFFGVSVAACGDVAVVGASLNGDGRAYVFEHDGANWNQIDILAAGDGQAGDRFGHAVACTALRSVQR